MAGVGAWKQAEEFLRSFWHRRTEPWGLVRLMVLAESILWLAKERVKTGIAWLAGHSNAAWVQHLAEHVAPVAFALVAAGCLGVWLWMRRVPRFGAGVAGILIALKPEPGSEERCAALVAHVRQTIATDERLRGRVECAAAPAVLCGTSTQLVSFLAKKSGARVLLRGRLHRGKHDGRVLEGITEGGLTLRGKAAVRVSEEFVVTSLAAANALRKFAEEEENGFLERGVLERDVREMTLYLCALGLTLEGRPRVAIPIFEGLLTEAQPGSTSTPFCAAIRRCLRTAHEIDWELTYMGGLVDHVTDREWDDTARCCDHALNAAAKLGSPNRMEQAILRFHYGDVDGAAALVRDVGKAGGTTSDPAYFLSTAFLWLWKGDARRALREYDQAVRRRAELRPAVADSAVRFLRGICSQYPERAEFRYGLAVVYDCLDEGELASGEYESFLESTASSRIPGLQAMREKAERRLKRLGGAEATQRDASRAR